MAEAIELVGDCMALVKLWETLLAAFDMPEDMAGYIDARCDAALWRAGRVGVGCKGGEERKE
jgi:hypothetical protein